MADPEQGVEIPLLFVGVEDVPILLANHFIIQHEQQEFLLMIGQIAPPLILADTPEERLEQAKNIAYVPVKSGRAFWAHAAKGSGVDRDTPRSPEEV